MILTLICSLMQYLTLTVYPYFVKLLPLNQYITVSSKSSKTFQKLQRHLLAELLEVWDAR